MKKRLQKRLQKGISLFISMMMVFSTMPLGVFAEDANPVPASVINHKDVSVSEIDPSKNGNDGITVKEEQTIKTDEVSGFQYQVDEKGITLLGFVGTLNDMKTIVIPETIEGMTVIKIAAKAINARTEVIKVLIPKGIMEIAPGAFEGCVNLEMITVDPENPEYYDESGMLYESASNKLILKPTNWREADVVENSNEAQSSKQALEIAETIETAEITGIESGFNFIVTDNGVVITGYDISKGLDVTIPETLGEEKVIGIGDNVFSSTAIETVSFNSGLQFIGSGAFYNCDELTTIRLPSALTTIDRYDPTTVYQGAFANCDNLEKVMIPSSVTVMGPDLFKDSAKVVINGSKGSCAQEYASEYSIRFAIVDLLSVNNFTASKTSGQNINTSIKISAKVTGGTAPYKYEFFYTTAEEPKTKQIIQKISAVSSANFETDQAGTYTLYVQITDKTGEKCLKSIDDFQIINIPSLTLTADLPTAQYVNTNINLAANIAAGTGTQPFKYKFYYTQGSETEIIKEYSEESTAVFTPETAGIYTLTVEVTDDRGMTTTKSIEKYQIVNDLSVKLTTDKASPQDVNTKIKLTAQGAGGKTGYQYKFYYILGEKTVTINNFSKTNSVYFTPSAPGNHTLYVDIKNAGGKTSTDSMDYVVADIPTVNSFTTDLPSGQCVGTAIDLIAEASGGSGALTYAFSCMMGKTELNKDIVQGQIQQNTAIFTPSQAGTYILTVTVTDTAKKTATKTITNYKVLEPVKVNLTANKASGQPVGTAITLKAVGSGGKAPYQYEFYYTKDGNKTPIKKYSSTNTANFIATEAGNYQLSVVIRDANGNFSELKVLDTDLKTEAPDPFVIVDTPGIDSFEAELPSGQFVGTAIELTAEASGGSGALTYEFSCMMGTTALNEYIVQGIEEENTATFTPLQAGTYILTVTVTDTANKTATKTITNYKVSGDVQVQSFTANKASEQNIGTSIKLTAVGTDGKAPYQYQFSYQLEDEEPEVIKAFSTAATANFVPEIAGDYKLSVVIKDANGIISEPKFLATDPYVIFDALVISDFEIDLPSGQDVYTPIELIANASGGTGALSYDFTCKLGTAEIEGVISSEPETPGIATFTPEIAGTYTLTVTVTDEDGYAVTKTITNYKVLNPVAVKSFTTNKDEDQRIVGANILLTAAGTGGKAPYQYQFSYQLGDGDPEVFRDFSTARTANFKPSEAGEYILSVVIKDANGNLSDPMALDSYVIFDVPVISGFTADPLAKKYVGSDIVLTANASGGTGALIYAFTCKLGRDEIEGVISQDLETVGIATFTPEIAGTYTLIVTVTDESGYEVTKTITNYKVLNPVTVKSFTTNKTEAQRIVGANILLTAMGTGGKSPYQYQFSYQLEGEEPVVRAYSTAKTAYFKPTEAGKYTLWVEIKDANGITEIKDIPDYIIK